MQSGSRQVLTCSFRLCTCSACWAVTDSSSANFCCADWAEHSAVSLSFRSVSALTDNADTGSSSVADMPHYWPDEWGLDIQGEV